MTSHIFQMPNQLDAVDPMVLTLKRLLEGHLADEAQFRFDICVSEALVNLVVHAETREKDVPIDIRLDVTGDAVTIEIFDPADAPAFDLREKGRALAEVDAMAEGGRGLGLILECANRVDYGAVQQRNRLELSFWGRN